MESLGAPDNRLYLGVGGSGKTTLALTHSWDYARCIVVDPNGENMHAGAAFVTNDPRELVELAMLPEFRICWRPEMMNAEDGYELATRVAWAAGNCALVWDEADFFMRAGRLPPHALRMWNAGRHRRCRVFAVSRSPFRVSRDCTRNLTRACVFAIQEPSDLKFLASFMGQEAANHVPALPQRHAIDWHQGGAWTVKRSIFA